MKRLGLITLLSFFIVSFQAQEIEAYQLYTKDGKKVSYKNIIKKLSTADILLFGEYHNNPITHWLQLKVTEEMAKTRSLILGAEMFEADNQDVLNDFLAGKIDDKAFDSLCRLWPNYYTDYAPLVNFAKSKGIPFIAANIPRRFARLVYMNGFEALDTLTEQEKAWIAPLPIVYDKDLPGYKKMLEMMGGHGGDNLPKAQAIKDATMAYFILKYFVAGSLFIHYNGAYHSDNFEGILWYLKQQKPDLNYVTISTVSQTDVSHLEEENKGRADFIICVDEEMTTTH